MSLDNYRRIEKHNKKLLYEEINNSENRKKAVSCKQSIEKLPVHEKNLLKYFHRPSKEENSPPCVSNASDILPKKIEADVIPLNPMKKANLEYISQLQLMASKKNREKMERISMIMPNLQHSSLIVRNIVHSHQDFPQTMKKAKNRIGKKYPLLLESSQQDFEFTEPKEALSPPPLPLSTNRTESEDLFENCFNLNVSPIYLPKKKDIIYKRKPSMLLESVACRQMFFYVDSLLHKEFKKEEEEAKLKSVNDLEEKVNDPERDAEMSSTASSLNLNNTIGAQTMKDLKRLMKNEKTIVTNVKEKMNQLRNPGLILNHHKKESMRLDDSITKILRTVEKKKKEMFPNGTLLDEKEGLGVRHKSYATSFPAGECSYVKEKMIDGRSLTEKKVMERKMSSTGKSKHGKMGTRYALLGSNALNVGGEVQLPCRELSQVMNVDEGKILNPVSIECHLQVVSSFLDRKRV